MMTDRLNAALASSGTPAPVPFSPSQAEINLRKQQAGTNAPAPTKRTWHQLDKGYVDAEHAPAPPPRDEQPANQTELLQEAIKQLRKQPRQLLTAEGVANLIERVIERAALAESHREGK